ncbi:hypothetical protein A5852_000993 [Enterococcus faecium]|nr:hypothetical protein A5852_000993 [Enterococcus faecium]
MTSFMIPAAIVCWFSQKPECFFWSSSTI